MVNDGAADQMTDSEIINLLGEYNFKEKEMSKILKELKSRDFEYVVNFIEQRRQNPLKQAKEENEKLIQQARELNEQNMRDAEIQERYKKRLLEKIQANRLEQKKKEEIENKSSSSIKTSVKIEGYIKIRAVCNGDQELHIGLGQESTVSDLYNTIKDKLKCSSLVIKRYGHENKIENTSEKIEHVFNAKYIMIDVEYK